ncbi:hypothetical protein [Enterococcus sp. DIV0802b]|uniref:hypothetical protein n=1 Tax=Enterococcus sp. DIV0802b TaxID=2774704 RepID=UPI003D300194
MRGINYTYKSSILTVGEKNKTDFFRENTSKGKNYQEIFLGQKTWHQVFDTPDPVEASESSSNEEAETTNTNEIREVAFSEVKYNPENGKMS